MGEDCLTLNVWTPDASPSAKLPVMVWIHGGALVFGSGRVPGYDGGPLAQRGAVVVTLNYRLGPLGFFAHPALAGQAGGPVNFGLLDQIAALTWVQRNVAAFGGDPDNVTVFGQSAGAESVLALYASPLAKGLFAKGIAQSAYGLPSHTRAKARAVAGRVATAVGLKGQTATAAQLRAVPAEAIAALDGKDQTLAPSFIAGDAALPQPILATFQRGVEHALPLVIGNTSDDGSIAVAFGVDPAQLVRKMGASRIALRTLYPADIDDARLGRETVRDVLFTTFARRLAYLHSARAPTWRYFFSYAPNRSGANEFGVPHGGEIAFTMGTVDLCQCFTPPTGQDRAVSARATQWWFDFAKAGTPVPADAQAWPRDTRRHAVVLEIGDAPQVRRGFLQARLNAFTGVLSVAGALTSDR
jgi:para-nitrobenzyl esterase